jgi:hypothetical protein
VIVSRMRSVLLSVMRNGTSVLVFLSWWTYCGCVLKSSEMVECLVFRA